MPLGFYDTVYSRDARLSVERIHRPLWVVLSSEHKVLLRYSFSGCVQPTEGEG